MPNPLRHPKTKQQAIGLLALGNSLRYVAEAVGSNKDTVNKLKKAVPELIDACALEIASKGRKDFMDCTLLPMTLAANIYRKGDLEQIEASKVLLGQSNKKEHRFADMVGYISARTEGQTFIQNIFNDNRTQVLDPIMAQSFKADAIRFNDDDIEDADYEEEQP